MILSEINFYLPQSSQNLKPLKGLATIPSLEDVNAETISILIKWQAQWKFFNQHKWHPTSIRIMDFHLMSSSVGAQKASKSPIWLCAPYHYQTVSTCYCWVCFWRTWSEKFELNANGYHQFNIVINIKPQWSSYINVINTCTKLLNQTQHCPINYACITCWLYSISNTSVFTVVMIW